MKKMFFLVALAAMFLSSCVDYSLDNLITEDPIVENPDEEISSNYMLKVNSSTVAINDTIYGDITNEILFFVTNLKDSLISIQCDFGDGTIDGGTQVLHKYKTAGLYKFKATVVGTSVVLNRTVKIGSPSITLGETIIQLSGNTIGDSASINLLCRKDKIFNYSLKGQYFLKGDMTSWKTGVAAIDTNYIYNGVTYLQFNFKVKNNSWVSFGYYKTTATAGEHWSYDVTNQFWDVSKGLYKFYVANGRIYKNELTANTPGSCGDPSNQKFGPTIRLDYETNGTGSDSLVIYANKNYLSGADSTKIGIGYTIDGGTTINKKARFIKNSTYFYIKAPITKSSTVCFKTYKDLNNLVVGDMTSSIFYRTETGDCYLTIAGSQLRSSGGLKITAANNETFIIR